MPVTYFPFLSLSLMQNLLEWSDCSGFSPKPWEQELCLAVLCGCGCPAPWLGSFWVSLQPQLWFDGHPHFPLAQLCILPSSPLPGLCFLRPALDLSLPSTEEMQVSYTLALEFALTKTHLSENYYGAKRCGSCHSNNYILCWIPE